MNDDAQRYFELGYRAQMERRLDEAIAYYRKSIAVAPTAEAHTFLGWALAWQGHLDQAIAECHTAIQIDPDFGNPYNDIGSYLIQLGRLDEAVSWLERAKHAARYEPKHYPYVNMSKIHVRRGAIAEAIAELRRAIDIAPTYAPAHQELHRLLGMVNGHAQHVAPSC